MKSNIDTIIDDEIVEQVEMVRLATPTQTRHNCRPWRLKYRLRNKSNDLTALTSWLDKTKSSLNLIYPQYLSDRNHNVSFDVKAESSLEHFVETSAEKETNSKVIKECKLNKNNPIYGNVEWPQSLVTSYQGEILCTDPCQHRIVVFSRDFIFKYQIGGGGTDGNGRPGSSNNEFNEPVDLIFNQLGKLLIADKNNYRIQVFTESRKYRDPNKLSIVAWAPPKRTSASQHHTRSHSVAKPVSAEYVYSSTIELNDKPVRIVTSPLASVSACSTESGYIYVINLMNQVVHFVKMNATLVGLAMRNICLNSDGSELIYLNTNPHINNQYEAYLRIYGLDPAEANNYDRGNQNRITRLKLTRKCKFEREYLPGVCLTKVGQIKIGIDLKSLVIYDVSNLNLLVYDMEGKFRSILLRAEEYLGNVLAFSFTPDQLHLVTVEMAATNNTLRVGAAAATAAAASLEAAMPKSNQKKSSSSSSLTSAGFEFKLRSYKFMECECHKNMVNKRNIYHEREKTADFEHPLLTASLELFN